jgi:drug/metabolite transporter (DMT)-like permease
MTLPITGTAQRPMLGILFMLLATSLFPVMNGLVKVLSADYTSEQIIWARTASHLVFVLALFAPRYGLRLLRTVRPGVQIARSLVLLASTTCFFSGVKFIPLAEAASISFMSPFIVALLAVPFLGEKVSPVRLIAVAVGFCGVLVVIRPGTDVFRWASLLIVGSALCYATYQILTRKVAGQDRPETSVVYSALVGTLVMTLIVPLFWTTPKSLGDALLLASLGVLGGLGHYCVARALTYATASVVSPFHYWQIVGSVLVGYLLFADLPDAYTWTGAALIIGSGLFIGWRETRERTSA